MLFSIIFHRLGLGQRANEWNRVGGMGRQRANCPVRQRFCMQGIRPAGKAAMEELGFTSGQEETAGDECEGDSADHNRHRRFFGTICVGTLNLILYAIKGTTRTEPNLLIWSPRVDGHFLPKDIPALIQDLTEAKPALLGLTEMESIYFGPHDA
jgi:hypothetical protein